jgi:hypothetical protein
LRSGAGECHSRWALRVPSAILRNPGHFAQIVDLAGPCRCCLPASGAVRNPRTKRG